jgi:hypothetical protein
MRRPFLSSESSIPLTRFWYNLVWNFYIEIYQTNSWLKMAVFLVVAPCSLVDVYRRFRDAYCLHHQGDGRQQASLKRRWTSTRLHGATIQKTVFFILAAVRTSNFTQFLTVQNSNRILSGLFTHILLLLLVLLSLYYFLYYYHYQDGLLILGNQLSYLIASNIITVIIQGDRKVTRSTIKYLLIVAIQYNSNGLINTHIVVITREPTQVMSCCNLLAPAQQLSFNSRNARTSFFKCNECSLSKTTWYFVLT